VVEIWRYVVVGDFFEIVKARISFVGFKDRRERFVSHRRFVIRRRVFRAAFRAFEAANEPGWQDARRGIHRRWYNGESRRGGSLACGLKWRVGEENAEWGIEKGKRGGRGLK